MRIEVSSGPAGTSLIVKLGETEWRDLAAGLETESRAWQESFRERVRDARILDGLRELETALASSRLELEEISQSELVLKAERRKLLEAGSATNGCEKKLGALLNQGNIVKGRIAELESIIASRIALAGTALAEEHDQMMQEMYAAKEKERTELEAEFFEQAGPIILKLLRLSRLSEARGHSLQAFRRRLSEGKTSELVKQFLDESAEMAAAATS